MSTKSNGISVAMLASAVFLPMVSGAQEEAKIAGELLTLLRPTGDMPAPSDNFGWSVARFGSDILVGSPGTEGPALDGNRAPTFEEAVYLFDGSTGALKQTFKNPDQDTDPLSTVGAFTEARDIFGLSVAPFGCYVAVAAPGDDPGGILDAGTVYVFDPETGNLVVLDHGDGHGTFYFHLKKDSVMVTEGTRSSGSMPEILVWVNPKSWM